MRTPGYIYLQRKLLDNPVVMKDAEHLAVWIYLLLKANHSPKDALFGKERITIQRGQLITGRKKISSDLGVNQSKVRRILKLFKSDQQIDQRTSPVNSLITILNYGDHQQVANKVDNRWPTGGQQVTTTNKYNKEKKEKKEEDLRLDIKAIWDKTKNRFGLVDDQYHYYRHCLVEMEQRWGDRTNEIVDRFLKDKESEIRDLRYLCERGIDKYAGIQPEELEKEKEITFVCPEGHKDRRVSKSKNLYAVCRKCYNRLVPIDKVALEKSIGGLA